MTTIWHGVTLDDRSAAMMDEVQALVAASPAPFTIDAQQGSYTTADPTSENTHAGGGAIDIDAAPLTADQRMFLVYAMRMVGWAVWLRTLVEGFPYHFHGIAVGCPDLSPEAQFQVDEYLAGRNGLESRAPDDGPRDFVGQTWEGYLAGDPVPGPTRVFRGVQMGFFDVVVTAGTLDPYADVYAGIDTRDDSITVTMSPGDEFYVYTNPGDFQPDDIISVINWRLNASGHGTLALAEATDTTFTWTSLGNVAVDTDVLALTATPSLPHTPGELNGDSGIILLRVTCVTGTVTLDWLILQAEPPSGLQEIVTESGHWSPWRTPGWIQQNPNYAATCAITNGELLSWTDGDPGMPDDIDDTVDAQVVSVISDVHTETWHGPPNFEPPVLASSIAQSRLQTGVLWSTPSAGSHNHQVFTDHANVITTAEWETWPDLREMPSFMAGLIPGVDFAPKPGAIGSVFDPLVVGEFAAGDTESIEWTSLLFSASIINFSRDLLNPFAEVRLSLGASYPASIAGGGDVQYDFADATIYVVTDTNEETAVGGPFTISPASGDGWTIEVDSSLDVASGMPPPTTTGGWDPPDMGAGGGNANHGATVEVDSTSLIGIQVQMPDYRYWVPGWIHSPDALDNTPPELILWLRQRQRNDGLGNSVIRAKGRSSRQRSLRQRGYR